MFCCWSKYRDVPRSEQWTVWWLCARTTLSWTRLYRTGALLGSAGRDSYQIEIKLKLTGLTGRGDKLEWLMFARFWKIQGWFSPYMCRRMSYPGTLLHLAEQCFVLNTRKCGYYPTNILQSMQSMYTFCAPQSSSGFWQWQKMPHDGKQSLGCSQSVNYLFITKDTQSLIVGLFHCVRHTTQCLLMILTRITKAAYIIVK